MGGGDEQEVSALTASDLASILKWSKNISSDINLSSGIMPSPFLASAKSDSTPALRRLTEIATGKSDLRDFNHALTARRNIWVSEYLCCDC
jgi:hypothetical protein